MVYVVILKQEKLPCSLKEIEKNLKVEFPSYDYMLGFLTGYLFDYYQLMTLEQFQDKFNSLSEVNFYIKFVEVI